MLKLEALTPTNIIAILATVVAIYSVFLSRRSAHIAKEQQKLAREREDSRFNQLAERELQVRVAANYLALETSSSDVFKYTANNEVKMAPLRGEVDAAIWSADDQVEGRGILINLYYQSLNLFEVCARFRRRDMITPEVFASWIAWMVEILEDSFFRDRWLPQIRSNYTRDVRDIFDVGVEIFSDPQRADKRNELFYAAVADIMAETGVEGAEPNGSRPCAVIEGWLEDIEKSKKWITLPSHPDHPSDGTNPERSPATLPSSRAA